MSVDLERETDEANDEFLHYRALSPLAIVSLVAGLFSVLALFDWLWLGIPLTGLLAGILAWRKIKSRPNELSGLALSQVGLALSVLFLFAGPSWLTYEYMHELPEGALPISYAELQPDPDVPGEYIPSSAKELEGKKVYIKGYVYPGQKTDGIKTFLLVRDQGDCCFGGNPKITDRVQVTLADPLRLKFSKRLHGVGGVFHVKPTAAVDGGGGVFYQLDADHLK